MNYKIISMDFDGTLLTSDKQVTEETRKTLMELKEKSYIIIGITARILPSVKNVCDINMFDYLILNNGNSLYDVKNKKELYKILIKLKITKICLWKRNVLLLLDK